MIGKEKDPTTAEGIRALEHITKVLFFGQITNGNLPSTFDRNKVAQNILSWKNKLTRDYINNQKIRNEIGIDPDKKITSTIKYITSGNLVKSVDKKGNKIFNNLSVIDNPNKVKLFT